MAQQCARLAVLDVLAGRANPRFPPSRRDDYMPSGRLHPVFAVVSFPNFMLGAVVFSTVALLIAYCCVHGRSWKTAGCVFKAGLLGTIAGVVLGGASLAVIPGASMGGVGTLVLMAFCGGAGGAFLGTYLGAFLGTPGGPGGLRRKLSFFFAPLVLGGAALACELSQYKPIGFVFLLSGTAIFGVLVWLALRQQTVQ